MKSILFAIAAWLSFLTCYGQNGNSSPYLFCKEYLSASKLLALANASGNGTPRFVFLTAANKAATNAGKILQELEQELKSKLSPEQFQTLSECVAYLQSNSNALKANGQDAQDRAKVMLFIQLADNKFQRDSILAKLW